MKTRTLEWISSAIEIATGVALIVLPDVVGRVLLGTNLAESGIAVGRLAGCGLLSLGLACLPSDEGPTRRATLGPVRLQPAGWTLSWIPAIGRGLHWVSTLAGERLARIVRDIAGASGVCDVFKESSVEPPITL